jgi:hypothetical protein
MRHGIATLCALASAVVGVAACAEESKAAIKELSVPAGEVTLHLRVVEEPAVGDALIARHGGPGNSSDYMQSLQPAPSAEFANAGLETAPIA